MKITVAFIAIMATSANFPALAGGTTDPLCKPLRAFIASVKPDESKELIFRTVWGSNFKGETQPALFAKSCDHGGYEPAATACKALMEQGTVEFSANNAIRVLSCLSPKTRFGSGVDLEHGAFSLTYGTPERGATVTIGYGEDSTMGAMALRVAADGY
jgi:hypothetical protein